MKNWIKTDAGNLINLDHVAQIYVHKIEEKWHVIGDIAGREAAFILSVAYDDEATALAARAKFYAELS